jgi:hypothetical protein
MGTLESQQLEPAVTDDSAVNVGTARDVRILIADVMVAANLVLWCVQGSPQEFEILRRQVAA